MGKQHFCNIRCHRATTVTINHGPQTEADQDTVIGFGLSGFHTADFVAIVIVMLVVMLIVVVGVSKIWSEQNVDE